MTAIRAIETRYAGCRFRSRLEARWAVFFDHLGITWQYEPEGFELDGLRYLPDFYLPATETWVEVKGSDEQADWDLLAEMVDWFSPLPGVRESFGTERGLLLLGPIPHVTNDEMPCWSILQHHKGIGQAWAFFAGDELHVPNEPLGISSAPDLPKGVSFNPAWMKAPPNSQRWLRRATAAYTAARSARFEHGEQGSSWR